MNYTHITHKNKGKKTMTQLKTTTGTPLTPYGISFGTNYKKDLSIKEIAKQAKKEIKNLYPKIKVSIRTSGKTIAATIKVKEINQESIKMKEQIESILESYQYKNVGQLNDDYSSNCFIYVYLTKAL